MKNTLTPLFCFGLLVVIFSQIDGVYCDPVDYDLADDSHGYDTQDQYDDQGMYQQSPDEIEETQKLLLWGCYFFTKKVLYLNSGEVNMLLAGHLFKDNLYKKIIADLMIDCVSHANAEDIRNLVQEDFDMQRYSHLHTFSIKKYEKMDVIEDLAERDLEAYLYFEDLEEVIRQQQGGESFDEFQPAEVKILGIPIDTISSVTRIMFFTSLAGMIIITIYNKITDSKKTVAAQRPAQEEKKEGEKSKSTEEKTKTETKKEKEAKKETKKEK